MKKMNWEFIFKYLPLYQEAALLTLKIGLIGIAVSIIIGLFLFIGSVLQSARAKADCNGIY